jgi:GntR family transcriptional regulator
VRQLAADLGVNLNTVATAYRELRDEGLVALRHGSGAVVAPRTINGATEGELRDPLRTALAKMVLAGLPRRKILRLVGKELRTMSAGGGKP